jgi:Zn-dependent peptidase ImmA (M78 family)
LAGKDTNTGAKRARQLRSTLGLSAESPIMCILSAVESDVGLPVIIAELPEGIAGCCWRDGDRVVLWVNGTHAAVRQRFTLAHELGHVRCGHDATVPVETIETLAGRTTDSREVQANSFAAELLAPADGVRSMIDREPTLDDVVLIAARYGISTIAALYRLNSLGLTASYEALKRDIEDGLHEQGWLRLSPKQINDVIATIEPASLPRLSPALAGSGLAALRAGAASIEDVSAASGCDAARLTVAATTIAV